MEDTTSNFIQAIAELRAIGESYRAISEKTGIDRRNLMRVLNDPEHNHPRPEWFAILCKKYYISPAFLLLGKGAPLE